MFILAAFEHPVPLYYHIMTLPDAQMGLWALCPFASHPAVRSHLTVGVTYEVDLDRKMKIQVRAVGIPLHAV